MYKHPWHPIVTIMKRDYSGLAKHYSRTEKPPKYYFIDFGLSRKYNPADGPPLELPIQGGDKSVPEFQDDGYDKPADPFRTDIYYLGSMIREAFLEVWAPLFHGGLYEAYSNFHCRSIAIWILYGHSSARWCNQTLRGGQPLTR